MSVIAVRQAHLRTTYQGRIHVTLAGDPISGKFGVQPLNDRLHKFRRWVVSGWKLFVLELLKPNLREVTDHLSVGLIVVVAMLDPLVLATVLRKPGCCRQFLSLPRSSTSFCSRRRVRLCRGIVSIGLCDRSRRSGRRRRCRSMASNHRRQREQWENEPLSRKAYLVEYLWASSELDDYRWRARC